MQPALRGKTRNAPDIGSEPCSSTSQILPQGPIASKFRRLQTTESALGGSERLRIVTLPKSSLKIDLMSNDGAQIIHSRKGLLRELPPCYDDLLIYDLPFLAVLEEDLKIFHHIFEGRAFRLFNTE